MEGRHVDVIEMDAASHTGINDIREIIDAAAIARRRRATRSTSSTKCTCCRTPAFNGLLKTLEEPPEHVKFIFATTEIRKVPITVLSRCQRFDLRRIEQSKLIGLSAGFRSGGHRIRRGAGDDRPGRRRLGARFAVAARPGHGPWRRRHRGGRPCARCWAWRTGRG
jgi:hypothetical protein